MNPALPKGRGRPGKEGRGEFCEQSFDFSYYNYSFFSVDSSIL